MIEFCVLGKPQPAGSKSAYVPLHPKTKQPFRRAGGGIMVQTVDANRHLKPWQAQIAAAGRRAYHGPLLLGRVFLALDFRFARPKDHFGTGRNAARLKPAAPGDHLQAPDVLKLSRGVEDALQGVIYKNDSQIVREFLSKDWGDQGGVWISVWSPGEPAPQAAAARGPDLPGLFDR